MKYREELSELPQAILPAEKAESSSSWHLFPIRLRLERLTADRAQIFRALRAENIGVNVHYIPVHLHPYYRDRFGYKGGEYPVAEQAYERLISLPMFHGMSDQDVNDVIRAILKVVEHYAQS
jgi:dTDP-4-amino-4,6-dideoxygalactose transaminase